MPGLTEDTVEQQELHCHNCNGYVRFPLDLSINGRHVLNCPNCGHEHCRVVVNGRITEERWDTRNAPTYFVSSYQVSYAVNSMTATTAVTQINTMWFAAGTTQAY